MIKEGKLTTTIVLISLAIVAGLWAGSVEAYTRTTAVTTCEGAKASNRAAKRWSLKTRPTNEKQYRLWLATSPYCSIEQGNANNHWLIKHYSSSGKGQSIDKYKTGAQEWIRDSLGKLSKACAVPRGFPVYPMKRKLQGNKGSCYVAVKEGLYAPYLHQWGVSNKNSEKKHNHRKALKAMNFNNMKLGKRR